MILISSPVILFLQLKIFFFDMRYILIPWIKAFVVLLAISIFNQTVNFTRKCIKKIL